VTYRTKHNEANGEDNHDGTDANFSQNCGAEGATKDAGIEALRKRQIKNFLLTLLISRGVPMLLGGDEVCRTQGGNNNAYCQDNETSWFDWTGFEQHQEIYRFACGMIAFRGAHPVLSKEQFYTDAEIRWFNPAGESPDWFDSKAKSLACLIQENEHAALLLMFNAGASDTAFDLPALPQGLRWHLAVDTSGLTPQDLFVAGAQALVDQSQPYRLQQHSSAILLVRGQEAASGEGPR
jgi:glycogen operon protein